MISVKERGALVISFTNSLPLYARRKKRSKKDPLHFNSFSPSRSLYLSGFSTRRREESLL